MPDTTLFQRPDPMAASVKTLLHVGCGHRNKSGTTPAFNTPEWREIRLDIDASVNPDVVCSMLDMGKINSDSVDAVFSSHNIEHLYAHEVPTALSEFHRVLKHDGFAVVQCPDLQVLGEYLSEGRLMEAAFRSVDGVLISPHDIIYGWGERISAGNFFMSHKTGFTKASLRKYLLNAGFVSVYVDGRHADIFSVASKAECDQDRLQAICRSHFAQDPIAEADEPRDVVRLCIAQAEAGVLDEGSYSIVLNVVTESGNTSLRDQLVAAWETGMKSK